eukprot:TRINITY_DN11761_c0_g1_i1.p2 TRINITY_DN11761_c0_g1~~TRINITY_DN11761_c0_g1_i1.p2  ORF type:complete len:118 (+),score=12.18 TRINITY_DN11761_c0_g1_i1:241-594(+)
MTVACLMALLVAMIAGAAVLPSPDELSGHYIVSFAASTSEAEVEQIVSFARGLHPANDQERLLRIGSFRALAFQCDDTAAVAELAAMPGVEDVEHDSIVHLDSKVGSTGSGDGDTGL